MAHINHRREEKLVHDRLIYHHEDPAKKLVRFMWWHEARKANPKLFYAKNHLVLAGYGGDISILTAMGVNSEAVVAVDENKQCVSYCNRKFRDVTYVYGTMTPKHLTGPLLYENGTFATAMLDFCGAPARRNLETMKAATKLVDPKGTIGCTFLTSRGTPELKAMTRQVCNNADAGLMANFGDIVRHAYNTEIHKKNVEDAVVRAHVTALMMSPEWFPQAIYVYKSHQERQTHTMFTMAFRKQRVKKVQLHNVETTEADIKEAILATDERPKFDAALMLNVPRMTVAGWKAHATRAKEKKS